MGAIRSCYEATTHFYYDSADTAKVLWYFVPEDTPNMPYPSLFCDTIWEARNGDVQQSVGELQTGHAYSKGLPPATYPVGAKLPCGTRQQWLNGASINDPFPGVYTGTTVPACCPDFLALANPGGASEGEPIPYPGPCEPDCFRPARVYLSITILGTDTCSLNGTVQPLDKFDATLNHGPFFTYKALFRGVPVAYGTGVWRWYYFCRTADNNWVLVLADAADITNWIAEINVSKQCDPFLAVQNFAIIAIPGCGTPTINSIGHE